MAATVMYSHLSYEDYKALEAQMKAFAETVHTTTPGPFYHKSIRLQISPTLIMEFHGPNVRGRDDGAYHTGKDGSVLE
jgi:hypothetical protein